MTAFMTRRQLGLRAGALLGLLVWGPVTPNAKAITSAVGLSGDRLSAYAALVGLIAASPRCPDPNLGPSAAVERFAELYAASSEHDRALLDSYLDAIAGDDAARTALDQAPDRAAAFVRRQLGTDSPKGTLARLGLAAAYWPFLDAEMQVDPYTLTI